MSYRGVRGITCGRSCRVAQISRKDSFHNEIENLTHLLRTCHPSRLITVVVTAAPFYRLPIIIDPRLCMFPSIEENRPLRNSLYWTLLEDRFPASDDSRRYCDNDEIDCCHPHIGYTSSHLFRCSNGLFPPLGEASSGFYAPELCSSVSRRPWI